MGNCVGSAGARRTNACVNGVRPRPSAPENMYCAPRKKSSTEQLTPFVSGRGQQAGVCEAISRRVGLRWISRRDRGDRGVGCGGKGSRNESSQRGPDIDVWRRNGGAVATLYSIFGGFAPPNRFGPPAMYGSSITRHDQTDTCGFSGCSIDPIAPP